MKPYTRTIDGKAIQVARLTPSQIIALLEEAHEARRAALVEDLEAAGVDASDRLEELQRLRDGSQSVMALMRLPFEVRWAIRMIEVAAGERPAWIEKVEPEELTRCGLWLLGQDLDALKGDGEGRAEGKA
jgi:hypothetical protein